MSGSRSPERNIRYKQTYKQTWDLPQKKDPHVQTDLLCDENHQPVYVAIFISVRVCLTCLYVWFPDAVMWVEVWAGYVQWVELSNNTIIRYFSYAAIQYVTSVSLRYVTSVTLLQLRNNTVCYFRYITICYFSYITVFQLQVKWILFTGVVTGVL